MKLGTLIVRLLLLALCAYLFLALLKRNDPMQPNAPMPFLLAAISWVDLFIHEGGHFIFSIFGRFLSILGGSLVQILIPLAAVVVLFRSATHVVPFAIFWLGENLVNVSVYVRDATRMKLRLISASATHDWNYILGQVKLLGSTDSIANVVFYLGLFLCSTAIVYGTLQSIRMYRTHITAKQSPVHTAFPE